MRKIKAAPTSLLLAAGRGARAAVWMAAVFTAASVAGPRSVSAGVQDPAGQMNYESPYFRVELANNQPDFLTLAVDSLGNGRLGTNLVRQLPAPSQPFEVRWQGHTAEYRPAGAPLSTPPVWSFDFSERAMILRSAYTPGETTSPLTLTLNPWASHATLLGLFNKEGSIRLPALLHFPDQGTFRINLEQGGGVALGYAAQRFSGHSDWDYVRVTFPAASAAEPVLEYALHVVDIYPGGPNLAGNPRFDGFRRNFLNIFQLSAHRRVLANNAASDPCAFTVYMYSAVARRSPPLAKGLTALDIVRQTLNHYLHGMNAYGIPDYNNDHQPYTFLDTYPSLEIAASDYVSGSDDMAWLGQNYPRLKSWAAKIMSQEDKDGLVSYPASGNSDSWPKKIVLRPANWWDTIGFGHEDAYSNALAYHALLGMAEMAGRLHRAQDAALYSSNAQRIRSTYVKTFYDPAPGVLAGWKSADGKLHDYYFTFINGVAISYGLVPTGLANHIMDHLLAKMKAVGYTHFQYGLPGNLIPIRPADYVDHSAFAGYKRFQTYENGGATADFAYFTLHALYKLGRRRQADAMLFPMLRGFAEGGFQGKGPNGLTYDWKTWNGSARGYEGLLADNYLALLAVLDR
jgi:hypothetical protein